MIRRLLIWLGLLRDRVAPPRRGRYEVFGGPLGGTWTDSQDLPGYEFGEDMYSERRYHVWQPAHVLYEDVEEALDNCRENTEDGWPWSVSPEELVRDLMEKSSLVEDGDPDVVRRHVDRYLTERRPGDVRD